MNLAFFMLFFAFLPIFAFFEIIFFALVCYSILAVSSLDLSSLSLSSLALSSSLGLSYSSSFSLGFSSSVFGPPISDDNFSFISLIKLSSLIGSSSSGGVKFSIYKGCISSTGLAFSDYYYYTCKTSVSSKALSLISNLSSN